MRSWGRIRKLFKPKPINIQWEFKMNHREMLNPHWRCYTMAFRYKPCVHTCRHLTVKVTARTKTKDGIKVCGL